MEYSDVKCSSNLLDMNTYKKGMVSIIIPSMTRSKWSSFKTAIKRRYLLRDTINDIINNVKCPYEIIVICNSYEDKKLVDYIVTNKNINKFCLNSVNVGVPRAWNMGAELAQGEFLCFANDDVEIGENSLEELIKVLSAHGIGQVGPMGTKWHRTSPGEYVGSQKIEEADAISGWLFVIKRQVFDQVGGFDIAYTPALCEEIDISFAIRNAGYKCLVVPGLNAKHHHISGASSTNRPLKALDIEIGRDELTARNKAYFEKKWSVFWE